MRKCPNCGSEYVEESSVTEWQPYLSILKAFEATFPVMICTVCEFSWRDCRSEKAIDDAMERFINPEEPFTRADQEALSAEADYYEGKLRGDA